MNLGFAVTGFWSIPIIVICLDKEIKRKRKLALIGIILGTFLIITFGVYTLGVLK